MLDYNPKLQKSVGRHFLPVIASSVPATLIGLFTKSLPTPITLDTNIAASGWFQDSVIGVRCARITELAMLDRHTPSTVYVHVKLVTTMTHQIRSLRQDLSLYFPAPKPHLP